jgi:hypothetical protein
VSCVRCAKRVSGLLLEASGVNNRCATPGWAQTLARNSSREAGTRIHTQTQTSKLTILFSSPPTPSLPPLSFPFTYTADDQHATVTDGDARSHNAPAIY